MRIIKPQQLIFLNGRYQLGRQSYLGVSVVAGVWLSKPRHFASEAEIWSAWEKAPLDNPLMDLAEPKPFAEYLLAGHVEAAQPVTTLDASVSVGGLRRQWRVQGESTLAALQVAPFTRMPLDHQYSYGGAGFAENPLGRGYQDGLSPRLMALGADGVPQVNSPLAAPCALPQHFQQRKAWLDRVAAEMAGEEYLQTLFPGYPPALDRQYFQLAAPQQHYHQPEWPDDIAFELAGFRASGEKIAGDFPRVRARLLYSRKAAAEQLMPLEMARKTLWLLPDSDLGLMIFTAAIPLDYLLQEPIATMLIALDAVDHPRDDAHFRGVQQRRLAKESSDFEFLYDPDLMPAGMGMNVINARQHNPNSLRYRAGPREDYLAYYQDLRQKLDQHQQRIAMQPLPALDNIQWEAFPSAQQKSLHQLLTAATAEPIEGELFTCQSVEQLTPVNMRFKQCQFVDCSFSQMTLEQCLFEYCQFENCTFSTVTLKQTALNHCRFTGGLLFQGHFAAATCQQSHFSQLQVDGFLSQGGQWKTCQFEQVKMPGASLCDEQWDSCTLTECDLSELKLLNCRLTASILKDCRLRQAQFDKVNFAKGSLLNCDCHGMSFRQSQLESGTLHHDCCVTGVKFDRCSLLQMGLRGLPFAHSEFTHCVVKESDFDHAQLVAARFILCDMAGVRFREANLQQALLDRCDLQQAVFYHADIRNSQFQRCNLVSANLSMMIGDRTQPFADCLLHDVIWYPLWQAQGEKR